MPLLPAHLPTMLSRPLMTASVLVFATVVLAACDAIGGGGYEIVERPQLSLAQAAEPPPAPTDTLYAIARVGERSYQCARLLGGSEAAWQVDTLLVTQSEAEGSTRYYCVPFNVWARTTGVEATARLYPADPHGEEPGYDGWVVRR